MKRLFKPLLFQRVQNKYFFTNIQYNPYDLEQLNLNNQEKQTLQQNETKYNFFQQILNSCNQKQNILDKKKLNLFYFLANQTQQQLDLNLFIKYIEEDKIVSQNQIEYAINIYNEHMTAYGKLNKQKFEYQTGIIFKETEEQIINQIDIYIQQNKENIKNSSQVEIQKHIRILKKKYPYNFHLKIYQHFQSQVKPVKNNQQSHIWDKIQNLNSRQLNLSINTPNNIKNHLEQKKGKLQFRQIVKNRFPPEPNGMLHLGHAKSIRLNFESALKLNGHCTLRFDDTNPDTETQNSIDTIIKNVQNLGYQPEKITYSSDYFDIIYEKAEELIKKELAYICSSTQEEMKIQRKNKEESKDRNRPWQESLEIFRRMKQGLVKQNEFSLRLKIDMKNSNPTLRDPVIYSKIYSSSQIKRCNFLNRNGKYTQLMILHTVFVTHWSKLTFHCALQNLRSEEIYIIGYQTDQTCINPLFGSSLGQIQQITFFPKENLIFFLRKIQQVVGMILGNYFIRLLTIEGLMRRGYNAEIISNFCDLISVTRRGNSMLTQIKVLENCARQYLFKKSERIMAVLQPIEIFIENLDKIIYVEREDVQFDQSVENQDFIGIVQGKFVGIKNLGVIFVKKIHEDRIIAEFRSDMDIKSVKGKLHWVSKNNRKCEIRIYDHLFLDEEPLLFLNFWERVNPDSIKIYQGIIEQNLSINEPNNFYQFDRVGYFCIDRDSDLSNKNYVFNLITQLNENQKIKSRKL